MAGIKGRSGRKTKFEEYNTSELVAKSLKTVRDFLNDESQPIEKRVDVAKSFALKHMPDKVENVGGFAISESIAIKLLDLIQARTKKIENGSPKNVKQIVETSYFTEILPDNNQNKSDDIDINNCKQ